MVRLIISARIIERRSSPVRRPQRNRRRYGIDLKNPFTMSKTARSSAEPLNRCRSNGTRFFIPGWLRLWRLVEPIGIEPMTSSLQS